MILGKESPVKNSGLFSVTAFSSVPRAYADWIYVLFPPEVAIKSISRAPVLLYLLNCVRCCIRFQYRRRIPNDQVVEKNIFHNVGHFLLAKPGASISKSHIFTVIFVGIAKIAFAFDIPAFALCKEECVCQMVDICLYGIERNGIFSASVFAWCLIEAANLVGLVRDPIDEQRRSRIADNTSSRLIPFRSIISFK